jgi:type II secretory pathway component PulK
MVLRKYLAREGSRVSLVFHLDVMHKLRPFVCILGT